MTNVKNVFSGNYLKAEDCKGGEIVEILSEGEIAEITSPEGKVKNVLNYKVSVDGQEKEWTPNRTCGQMLMQAWGEDDKNWIGKKFQIELMRTQMFGKVKNAILVKLINEAVKEEAKKPFSFKK